MPAGVPVAIMSPGFRVITLDMKLMSLGTLNISSEVQECGDLQIRWVDFRFYHRPDRREGVESLCPSILNVLDLKIPGGYVIYARISEYTLRCLRFVCPLCLFADHYGELSLVIDPRGHVARVYYPFLMPDYRRGWFQKEQRLVRNALF